MIYPCLDPKLILFLDQETKEGALLALVHLLEREKRLIDPLSFQEALFERENQLSTAVGYGVAIPHAKLPGYSSFFIAIGIHPQGLLWPFLDDLYVHLIFLIGGPSDQPMEYLQLLSQLTSMIKNEERRKKMLQLREPEKIMALFEGV